jgi:hypothetical protein
MGKAIEPCGLNFGRMSALPKNDSSTIAGIHSIAAYSVAVCAHEKNS